MMISPNSQALVKLTGGGVHGDEKTIAGLRARELVGLLSTVLNISTCLRPGHVFTDRSYSLGRSLLCGHCALPLLVSGAGRGRRQGGEQPLDNKDIGTADNLNFMKYDSEDNNVKKRRTLIIH